MMDRSPQPRSATEFRHPRGEWKSHECVAVPRRNSRRKLTGARL